MKNHSITQQKLFEESTFQAIYQDSMDNHKIVSGSNVIEHYIPIEENSDPKLQSRLNL
jgi:hypothetical protein